VPQDEKADERVAELVQVRLGVVGNAAHGGEHVGEVALGIPVQRESADGVAVPLQQGADGPDVLERRVVLGRKRGQLVSPLDSVPLRALPLHFQASDLGKYLLYGTRKDFVTNSLVLIEPAKDGVGVKSLQDLTGASVKKIAVGKTATVPVGRYTRQVLEGAGLWSVLEPKFVQADSVRQVLDYVARGEAEAGFVYRTDASIMSDKVRIALTVDGHAPVRYPVAVVSDSRHKTVARDFAAYLTTPAVQEVLGRFGFGRP